MPLSRLGDAGRPHHPSPAPVVEPSEQSLDAKPKKQREVLGGPVEHLATGVEEDAVLDQLRQEGFRVMGVSTNAGDVPDGNEADLTTIHQFQHLLKAGTVL